MRLEFRSWVSKLWNALSKSGVGNTTSLSFHTGAVQRAELNQDCSLIGSMKTMADSCCTQENADVTYSDSNTPQNPTENVNVALKKSLTHLVLFADRTTDLVQLVDSFVTSVKISGGKLCGELSATAKWWIWYPTKCWLIQGWPTGDWVRGRNSSLSLQQIHPRLLEAWESDSVGLLPRPWSNLAWHSTSKIVGSATAVFWFLKHLESIQREHWRSSGNDSPWLERRKMVFESKK